MKCSLVIYFEFESIIVLEITNSTSKHVHWKLVTVRGPYITEYRYPTSVPKLLQQYISYIYHIFYSISWKPLRFASWFPTLISCSPNLPRVYIRYVNTETILHFFILKQSSRGKFLVFISRMCFWIIFLNCSFKIRLNEVWESLTFTKPNLQ